MKSKVFAVLTMLAAMTSGAVLAQDVPLPQVERQSSATRISSTECNEPPVPELREPVSTPVLIAEETRQPARPEPERPFLVAEARQVELQPTPSEEQLSAAQAMALLQRTVRTGPYDDFQRALAVAKQKVAAMSASNERRAFTEALDAYSDISLIWEHAMTHPIGAFFNDELLSGAFTRLARKYPSYAAYIAQQSVTDSAGNTLYPTIETRMFLADEADRRLRGIRLPSPPPPGVIAELPTRPAPEVRREPVRPRPRPQQPVTRPTERPRPSTTTKPKPPRTTTARPSTTQPRPRKTTPRPVPAVKPPVREPAVVTRPAPAVKPPVEKPAVTTKPVTVSPPPSTTAAPSTGEPIQPTTAVEAAPTTTPTATAAPPPPPVERAPVQLPEEPRRALPSQTTLLLVAFGLIALIAIALMIRALRPKQAPSTLLTTQPPETTRQDAAPGDADWIDPETRHWIEDVNKTDKPPN